VLELLDADAAAEIASAVRWSPMGKLACRLGLPIEDALSSGGREQLSPHHDQCARVADEAGEPCQWLEGTTQLGKAAGAVHTGEDKREQDDKKVENGEETAGADSLDSVEILAMALVDTAIR
jgi:hypothetical protein